jgi:hypothetical protein
MPAEILMKKKSNNRNNYLLEVFLLIYNSYLVNNLFLFDITTLFLLPIIVFVFLSFSYISFFFVWFNSISVSEQDKGLESLSDIIVRQKFMAQGISTEIDLQNGK